MIPTYQIFIENSEELQIALVTTPAIEESFLFFGSERMLKFDSYKKIISGPVLVPNLKIYRNQPEEHYVFYDEENVVKSAQLFFKNGMKFNYKHTSEELPIEIFESYLTKEDNEWENLPKNSWIVSAKVLSDEVFEDILSGNLQGFSFQGLYSYSPKIEEFNKIKEKNMEKTLKEKLFDAINSIFFNETEEVKEVVDQVEETTEQIEEEFEQVESLEVQSVVEEVVDIAENVVEEAPTGTLTIEEVKALMESVKEEIMMKVQEMVAPMTEQMSKVNEKVEEFSKQPITESVKVEEKVTDKMTRAERIIALARK